jgi:hypothetical protein
MRSKARNGALIAMLAAIAALVAMSIGSTGTAAGASASASAAAGSGDDATAARRRGRRGPRGRRGARGPGGPTGPTGPAGPAGPVGPAGTGGGGGVVPLEFRGNIGTPTQVLFFANGIAVEQDCTSIAAGQARVRSTAEDGVAASFSAFLTAAQLGPLEPNAGQNPQNIPAQHIQTADTNFDVNQILFLTGPLAAGARVTEGTFSASSLAQNVTTGVFLSNLGVASPQGDCVYIGTINRD